MRICYFIFLFWMLIGCTSKSKNQLRNYTSLTTELIYADSVSIRAILAVDENRVWFAGNKGQVGIIDHKIPKIASIRFEDSLLHFRSIAKTQDAVFVLSIANPAVLYKIGFDGLQATSIEEVYIERGDRVFYDALKFWDDQMGIALGDPTEACLSVLISNDGGNNWKKWPCDRLPKVEEGEHAFAASNSNIAIYGNHVWLVSGGTRARVFYSIDRGESWHVVDTPIVQGGTMTGIYSIDFYDENIGIIFGGDWENKENNVANKAITIDGGKTWQLISDGRGPGYRSSVKFVPNGGGNEIVAVGSPGISYSNDRGHTWKELSIEGVFAIDFVNDSVAFASGNNKIIKVNFKQ